MLRLANICGVWDSLDWWDFKLRWFLLNKIEKPQGGIFEQPWECFAFSCWLFFTPSRIMEDCLFLVFAFAFVSDQISNCVNQTRMEEMESSKSGFSKHKKLTFWVLNELKGEVTDLGLFLKIKPKLFYIFPIKYPIMWMQTRMMEEVERTPVVSLKKNGMFNKVATIGWTTMMLMTK